MSFGIMKECFKRNRNFINFGFLLILFSWYSYPIIQEAKYKNKCIKLTEKAIIYELKKEVELYDAGLSIKEIAVIEGYKNCNNNYRTSDWSK